MPQIIHLNSISDLDAALNASHNSPVVLYKHSSTCFLSTLAYREIKRINQDNDPIVYQVTVQTARPLSNHIEKTFGIRHESPQVFILSAGRPVYNTSHRKIKAKTVRTEATLAS